MNKTILYNDGHKCIDNKVGDYDFVCPTAGYRPGFIPYMAAGLLDCKKFICGCGIRITEKVEV